MVSNETETLQAEVEHLRAAWKRADEDANAALGELAKFKRGGKTLGHIIEWQCRAVVDATGMHHLIDEDGDGDWGLIWEHLAELRPRAERAEAKVARVKALADEWSCHDCSDFSIMCDDGCQFARELRAALDAE